MRYIWCQRRVENKQWVKVLQDEVSIFELRRLSVWGSIDQSCHREISWEKAHQHVERISSSILFERTRNESRICWMQPKIRLHARSLSSSLPRYDILHEGRRAHQGVCRQSSHAWCCFFPKINPNYTKSQPYELIRKNNNDRYFDPFLGSSSERTLNQIKGNDVKSIKMKKNNLLICYSTTPNFDLGEKS